MMEAALNAAAIKTCLLLTVIGLLCCVKWRRFRDWPRDEVGFRSNPTSPANGYAPPIEPIHLRRVNP